MKHLIIFAHPYAKSFGRGIVDTIVNELKNREAEVRVRDLYEIGFDPVLKGTDLLSLRSGNYAEDIKAEQEHIKWADVITFVYPVWWAGLPAILKGYVDRVFANGFAFHNVEGRTTGLLEGKKALLVCTTGASDDVYEQIGMHKSMKQTTDGAIFEFCGMEVVKHVFFGDVPSSTPEDRTKYLGQVEELIRVNF
jgi:NAD(P)H dehydrogenase (quinone)